ncbi:hypothetical protein PQQ73_06290 [Paraburkholderia strydomiana]|uniref:Terminase n=1 Tax=Paraburkholderia strydomiana TaxID=1245417 RepID=A0ABW9EAB8_9BURK
MSASNRRDRAGPAKRSRDCLDLPDPEFQDEDSRATYAATNSLVRAGVTGRKYAEPMFGTGVDLTQFVDRLRIQVAAVNDGNLSEIEATLIAQASTLDMIFNELAAKAARCEIPLQTEMNLRLALKAQAQCRVTLEALVEMKNPRPVAFVRQANIANGPQQVNNQSVRTTPPSVPRAHAENSGKLSNELLEANHGQWMDAGTTSKASATNKQLEALGKLDGPDN